MTEKHVFQGAQNVAITGGTSNAAESVSERSVLRLPHSHAGNHQSSVYGNLTTSGDSTLPGKGAVFVGW